MVRCDGINFGALGGAHNQTVVAWLPSNASTSMTLYYSFSAGSDTFPSQSVAAAYNDLDTSGYFVFSGHYKAEPI